MTPIQTGRPLRRVTAVTMQGLPIVAELHPKHIHLRLKGQRNGYDLHYENLMWIAIRRDTDTKRLHAILGKDHRRLR